MQNNTVLHPIDASHKGCRQNFSLLVGAVIGFVFFAVGIGVAVFAPPTRARDAILENLVETQAEYETIAADVDVVVYGMLDRNDPVLPPPGAVALTRQELNYEQDDDGSDWTWDTVEQVMPSLNIALQDGDVRTQALGNRIVEMRGAVFTLEEYMPGSYNYQGESIAEGAIRSAIVTDGEWVTVVGTKDQAGQIYVRQFYLGDPDGLLQELNEEITFLRIFGAVFSSIGLIVGVAMLIAGSRSTDKSSFVSTPELNSEFKHEDDFV